MIRRPPRSTRTDTRFPYTTLFRSSRNDTVTEIPEWPKDKLDRPASFSVFVQGKRRIGAVLHRRKADKDHIALALLGGRRWRCRRTRRWNRYPLHQRDRKSTRLNSSH